MLPGRAVSFCRQPLAVLIFVSVLSAVALAADPVIGSIWRVQNLAIDGVNSEWTPLTSLEKGPAVAVANDAEFAYVIVSTSDQQIRRQLGRGLVFWFDPARKKQQTFGIRIPGAMRPPLGQPVVERSDSALITPPPAGTSREHAIEEFDVFGPGKSQRRLVPLESKLGIELASMTSDGVLVYELKVPLARTDARAYAIGTAPGGTISLGLATLELPRSSGPRGGGGFRGGFQLEQYGPAGGRGGGGFGAGRDSQEETVKPLSRWVTVKLAAAPPK